MHPIPKAAELSAPAGAATSVFVKNPVGVGERGSCAGPMTWHDRLVSDAVRLRWFGRRGQDQPVEPRSQRAVSAGLRSLDVVLPAAGSHVHASVSYNASVLPDVFKNISAS